MKKIIAYLIITTILFLSCFAAFSQDVIDLNLLAAKKVKSTTLYAISDNTIDFRGIKHSEGYWVKFIGTYSRSLHVKNFIGGEIIHESTITTNTSDKTLKFTDCRDFKINGEKSFLNGSGNSSGQMIYVSGKWQNCYLLGFTIDQKRNKNKGSTPGGAAVQFESYSDPSFSHGTLTIDGTIVVNSNDEPFYVLYNQPTKAYLDTLRIRNTKIQNAGRDFYQFANVRWSHLYDNVADNGGLEQEPNHISGFSLNDGNKYVKLENNRITNIPQYIFSGTVGGKLETFNNVYIQGTSSYINNQAIYTKSNTFLSGDSIIAPKVLIAAIAQDKAQVTYQGLTIVSPKVFRYNTPVPVELPIVKTEPVQAILETSVINGITKKVLIYEGIRIEIK